MIRPASKQEPDFRFLFYLYQGRRAEFVSEWVGPPARSETAASAIGLMQRIRILLWLAAFWPAGLAATILPVSTLGDTGPGSLRTQAEIASDGDTLQFQVDGTVFLQTPLYLLKNLTILGLPQGDVRISGSGSHRLMEVGPKDTVILRNLTLQGGYSAGLGVEGGGAIKNSGAVFAYDCLFLNNEAEAGGAIENSGFGGDTVLLHLERCAFVGNRATKKTTISPSTPRGGAIYSDTREGGSATVYMINCTFSGNHAHLSGGAIYQLDSPLGNSATTLISCTFAGNSSTEGVGGLDYTLGRVPQISGCIVAGNEGASTFPNQRGIFLSQGYNLFEDTLETSFNIAVRESDIFGAEADLLPLARFAPRTWLHALACTSPALDNNLAASSPSSDQRGSARVGVADRGAYERNEALDGAMTHLRDDGLGSLRFLLGFACPGDTMSLPPLGDTLRLASPLHIDREIVVNNHATQPIVLHGSDSTRLFEVSSAGSLSLTGFDLMKGNAGNGGGGAIFNQGKVFLSGCTLAYHHATAGGAVANHAQAGDTVWFEAVNCTFSNNYADWLDGGAIDNRAFGENGFVRASLLSCTLGFNEAYVRGGAIAHEGGLLELDHCLVDRNLAPYGEQMEGEIISLGHNLIRNPEGIIGTFQSTDIIDYPSNFLPLSRYGGPTLTHALPAYSVAVDAGTESATASADQRGLLRVFGARQDIGAVEFQGLVAVDQEKNPVSMAVFPNPSREFILSVSGLTHDASLHLFNLEGKEMWRQPLSPAGQSDLHLSPGVPAGVYILELRHQGQHSTLRLLIP